MAIKMLQYGFYAFLDFNTLNTQTVLQSSKQTNAHIWENSI